jgi:hypothetical protein
MAEIKLSNGIAVLLDDEDFERLHKYKWYQTKNGYIMRHETWPKTGTVYMHREILGAQKGELIDHANHIKYDNRRVNLRFATPSQNIFNQPISSANTSGYVGVCYVKEKRKWRAKIYKNKKAIYLGYFDNKHDAARMYNFWSVDLYGEFARINVIKEESAS